MLLLRSVLAPVLLVASVVLSYGAAMGVSALVFNNIFGFPGADATVPLFGFVFLVALGVDYNIFLMSRVREESLKHGTRAGILRGLGVTGGVITSAGVVLAATFAALSVIPIMFLVQLAFIVAFGVLLDTVLVRSLLVPALAYDIGRADLVARQAGPARSRCRGPPRGPGRPGSPAMRPTPRPPARRPPSARRTPYRSRRHRPWAPHQATVAAAASCSGVGARPRAAWLAAESITNGRSNWYSVSAIPHVGGKHAHRSQCPAGHGGDTRCPRAPAASANAARDLRAGSAPGRWARATPGSTGRPVRAAAIMAAARSGNVGKGMRLVRAVPPPGAFAGQDAGGACARRRALR